MPRNPRRILIRGKFPTPSQWLVKEFIREAPETASAFGCTPGINLTVEEVLDLLRRAVEDPIGTQEFRERLIGSNSRYTKIPANSSRELFRDIATHRNRSRIS